MVTFRCTACGKEFSINDYLHDISEEMWEDISRRPSNRA
jgi:DNA-directed RNA polymerase subunit RPC12/RpoP